MVISTQQELYSAIGKRIRQQRKSLKWTQEALAERAETTPQYISRIERGKVCPSLEFLYRFAKIFDCPVYALLPASQAAQLSFFSQELEYQLNHCSQWKKQFIVNYVSWFLQQPEPSE